MNLARIGSNGVRGQPRRYNQAEKTELGDTMIYRGIYVKILN